MVDLLSKGFGGGVLLLGLMPSTASALPWDIDMVDGYFYRAYEWSMQEMPDGVVARNPRGTRGVEAYASDAAWGNNTVAGGMYIDALTREVCDDADAVARLDEAQTMALSAKMYNARDESDDLVKGKELFDVYCVACHGEAGLQGAPVMERWGTITAPPLAGTCVPQAGVDYSSQFTVESSASEYCMGKDSNQQSCVSGDEFACVWQDGQGDKANPVSALCDAGLFATIRNGSTSKIMRGYHQAMNSDEIWAVVAYVRELPGNAETSQ
jgi:mono/diheme cytochrome c family protein